MYEDTYVSLCEHVCMGRCIRVLLQIYVNKERMYMETYDCICMQVMLLYSDITAYITIINCSS